MSSASKVSRESKAAEYTAQPTAPSSPDAKVAADDSLWISWLGPDGEHQESQLSQLPLRIGRESTNEVVLGGNEVSRRHAQIVMGSPGWIITDMSSRNGLLLNGERQASGLLQHGTVLRLGDWVGVVARGIVQSFHEVAPGLWGSLELERALVPARVAAPSRLSLIVEGETGTGKELAARAIHAWSRLGGAFVAVNCAALTESLLEAELFGNVRGAFTGALTDRLGHLREADGGLLLLDEIGELALSAQAKLLRALQEQEVTPLGTSKRIPVCLRVVAATHRNLRQMAQAGTFRADLLARLEGLVIRLPALRERRVDIVPLFRAFAAMQLGKPAPSLSAELVSALSLYGWPGNVRELKQCADRTAILHGSLAKWGVHQVGQGSLAATPSAAPKTTAPMPGKRSVSRGDLTRALEAANGIVTHAASTLEISKQTFYKLLADHDIDVSPYRKAKLKPR